MLASVGEDLPKTIQQFYNTRYRTDQQHRPFLPLTCYYFTNAVYNQFINNPTRKPIKRPYMKKKKFRKNMDHQEKEKKRGD